MLVIRVFQGFLGKFKPSGFFIPFGACLLGVTILGWVAMRVGPQTGRVIAHVTESNVEVRIDGEIYHIEGAQSAPLVLELSIGRHQFVMLRDGALLHEESFTICGGAEVVLTTWQSQARVEDQNDPLHWDSASSFDPNSPDPALRISNRP